MHQNSKEVQDALQRLAEMYDAMSDEELKEHFEQAGEGDVGDWLVEMLRGRDG